MLCPVILNCITKNLIKNGRGSGYNGYNGMHSYLLS